MGDLKSISVRHRDLQRLCLSVIEQLPGPVPSKNGNETIAFLPLMPASDIEAWKTFVDAVIDVRKSRAPEP